MLEELENKALPMGKLARQVFNTYFAPNIFLDQLVAALISKYANLPFTLEAICWRAGRAAGWREIRTLCHQVLAVRQ